MCIQTQIDAYFAYLYYDLIHYLLLAARFSHFGNPRALLRSKATDFLDSPGCADVIVYADEFMSTTVSGEGAGEKHGDHDGIIEFQRQKALLKTGALQDAIFNSAYFSGIATDEKGAIQIFNVGAERMLGYEAAGVVNRITPADPRAASKISTS